MVLQQQVYRRSFMLRWRIFQRVQLIIEKIKITEALQSMKKQPSPKLDGLADVGQHIPKKNFSVPCGMTRRISWQNMFAQGMQDQKSLGSKPEEPQNGPFLLLPLLLASLIEVAGTHGLLLPAPALLGLLEVVEDGAFGDAEHVPDAVEIGLVLVLHALQPLVYDSHPLLNGLHLQLHEGGNALVEGGVVDLLLDAVAFLAHEAMDLREGNILLDLLHGGGGLLHHAALDLLEDAVVVLNQLPQLVLQLVVDQLHDHVPDLLHHPSQHLGALLRPQQLAPKPQEEVFVGDEFVGDCGGVCALHARKYEELCCYAAGGGRVEGWHQDGIYKRSLGISGEEGLEDGDLFLFQLPHETIAGDLQVVDLDVPAQSPRVIAHEEVQQLIQLGRVDVCFAGTVAVVDQDAQHLEVLRVQFSRRQDLHVILEFEAQFEELCLLPLDVLPEDLNDVLKVERQHEHPMWIVPHSEPIPQQQFVIVQCSIGKGGSLSGLDVHCGPDPHEGRLPMREVEQIKLTVGREGVIEAVEEGRCEFESSIACIADDGLALVAGVEELLLLRPLQQLLLEEAEGDAVSHLPALIQFEQKPRIYIRLGDGRRLSPEDVLRVVPEGHGGVLGELGVGDELEVDAHAGHVVLVHGVVLLGELLHLLADLLLLGGVGTRQSR